MSDGEDVEAVRTEHKSVPPMKRKRLEPEQPAIQDSPESLASPGVVDLTGATEVSVRSVSVSSSQPLQRQLEALQRVSAAREDELLRALEAARQGMKIGNFLERRNQLRVDILPIFEQRRPEKWLDSKQQPQRR